MEQLLHDPAVWTLLGVPLAAACGFFAGRFKKRPTPAVNSATATTSPEETTQGVTKSEVMEALSNAGLHVDSVELLKRNVHTVAQLNALIMEVGSAAVSRVVERMVPLSREYLSAKPIDLPGKVGPTYANDMQQASVRAIVYAQLSAPKNLVHPAFIALSDEFARLSDDLWNEVCVQMLAELPKSTSSGPWVDAKLLLEARKQEYARTGHFAYYLGDCSYIGWEDRAAFSDAGLFQITRQVRYGGPVKTYSTSTWELGTVDLANTEEERMFWIQYAKFMLTERLGAAHHRKYELSIGGNALSCTRFIEALQAKAPRETELAHLLAPRVVPSDENNNISTDEDTRELEYLSTSAASAALRK